MPENENLTDDFKLKLDELDDLLNQVDYDNITAEGTKKELGDGYYLTEVESAELTTSRNTGNLMVKITWRVVEDGFTVDMSSGMDELIHLTGTKGQRIYKYYPLKDENNITRFISDMIKFEKDGQPLVPAKYWSTVEKIQKALQILPGRRIYVQISDTTISEDGVVSNWRNPLSWSRAKEIGLPVGD